MIERGVFYNISPLDSRYAVSEREVFERLSPFLSEDAQVASCLRAEMALLKAHLVSRGCFRATDAASISDATLLEKVERAVSTEDVYAEEEKTHHAIRALVNVVKRTLEREGGRGREIAPLVHLGATSADILDTAFAFRMKGAAENVVLPELRRLLALICAFAEREADTPQIGRTHGQHALPITAGFAFAEYAARLGKCVAEIEKRAADQRGKLSGATGSYNALCLITENPEELERLYCAELGLEPSEYSTQLVEPEYALRLLLEYNIAFGVIANLADDLRNLQRSEIGELFEQFDDTQVGSSTMPQKRNPWNSEHVKSLWKAFSPHVVTFFMDQISEHQRDLTNSASKRFVADYIAAFAMAVSRMTHIMEGLRADRDAMLRNLRSSGGAVLAEAAYILLAEAGESGAHEVIRRITLRAEKDGTDFADALFADDAVFEKITAVMLSKGLAKDAADTRSFFTHPERYAGLAAQKGRAIAAKYESFENP